MSRFVQDGTGVVISVADHEDHRFVLGWTPCDTQAQPEKSDKRSPERFKKSESK